MPPHELRSPLPRMFASPTRRSVRAAVVPVGPISAGAMGRSPSAITLSSLEENCPNQLAGTQLHLHIYISIRGTEATASVATPVSRRRTHSHPLRTVFRLPLRLSLQRRSGLPRRL